MFGAGDKRPGRRSPSQSGYNYNLTRETPGGLVTVQVFFQEQNKIIFKYLCKAQKKKKICHLY